MELEPASRGLMHCVCTEKERRDTMGSLKCGEVSLVLA